jgi:hypothetical protein
VGFHQETASRFAPRVVAALRALLADPAIEVVTLETAATRARAQLRSN